MDTFKLKLIRKANLLLKDSMRSCKICPRGCGADRESGKRGYCRAGNSPAVYSYLAHHGEEPPISGSKGSGTIFFSHCNMKCVYCQNYCFSQLDKGEEISVDRLASIMLGLQSRGCHNINLVTPTHYLTQILSSLEIAVSKGLSIPIIYNTSGYELAGIIKLLDGIVDVYLPDMRYSDDRSAKEYSDAAEYVKFNRSAVAEMHRQAGDLKTDVNGTAVKGMIIRLLAIPNDKSGTVNTMRFIRDNLSPSTYLSIMSQYYPTFKASEFDDISGVISKQEYANIIDESHRLGLNNGWVQDEPDAACPDLLGTNIKPIERTGEI